jgi:hypothetical protein
MTSRVEEQNAKNAAEAERLNKKIEREGRDAKASDTSRDAFSKLVRTNQQSSSETKKQGEREQTEARQGEAQAQKGAKNASEADRAARLARGGALSQNRVLEQARSFQGVLTNQQAQTQEADKGRVERREAGTAKDRVEAEDKTKDVDKQEATRDAEVEQAKVEARNDAKANGAINPDGSNGGQQRDKRSGQGDEGGQKQPLQTQAPVAKGAQGPREVRQIPPEILEKLCSAVWLGVNEKGLREFQIELKDGPLKGAHVKITAEDGKVALTFTNVGGDEKRLLEASKGDLMRRLEKKGLSLARLDVK